jgi:c-di-GMP-binding flagellar brake protein YcgR
MLNARGQAKLSPVRLKRVDCEACVLLITQLWNDAEHAALMTDRHVNLSARHFGLPVFFTVDVLDTSEIGGSPCYRIPFPAWILAMEMRDSLRVRLPDDLRACLQCSLPPDLHIEARVIDVSEGGICVAVPTPLAERIGAMTSSLPAQFRAGQEAIGMLRLHPRRTERQGDITLIGATIELDSELGRRNLRRLIMAHQRNLLQLQ